MRRFESRSEQTIRVTASVSTRVRTSVDLTQTSGPRLSGVARRHHDGAELVEALDHEVPTCRPARCCASSNLVLSRGG